MRVIPGAQLQQHISTATATALYTGRVFHPEVQPGRARPVFLAARRG